MTSAIVGVEESLEDQIREAVERISNALNLPGATKLIELSSNTVVTGIDVYEESSLKTSIGYLTPATVHVELNYGGKKDGTVIGDSFPAEVSLRLKEGRLEVSDIDVDTTSFYD